MQYWYWPWLLMNTKLLNNFDRKSIIMMIINIYIPLFFSKNWKYLWDDFTSTFNKSKIFLWHKECNNHSNENFKRHPWIYANSWLSPILVNDENWYAEKYDALCWGLIKSMDIQYHSTAHINPSWGYTPGMKYRKKCVNLCYK